jgi:hypothetical protein
MHLSPPFARTSDFVEDRYSWRERQRRQAVWWRRHCVWRAEQSWPARVCLVLLDVTAVYLALVLGFLVAVGPLPSG